MISKHRPERLVLTTCPDAESAGRIASALVDTKLAACVNIVAGIRSVYRWKGKVEYDEEHLLIIKTHVDRYAEVERAIRNAHPYELPEVVSVAIDAGSDAYLAWIDASVDAAPEEPNL